MPRFDAIVLGVGAMGAGACWRLAARGKRVLGLEQFELAHDRGSSHGETRICRKAYFEHPDYVPLLCRAYELWDELERLSGQRLFHRCGLALFGAPDSQTIAGARRAAELHRLDIEPLDRAEIARRFPMFRPPDGRVGLFERDAGYLRVEACVRAQVEAALRAGATIHANEAVRGWSAGERGVSVATDRGEYEAARLIITAGPWSGPLLRGLNVPLEVLRKPQLWFGCADPRYLESSGCPVFAFDYGAAFYYGFPCIEPGRMKIAEHLDRDVAPDPDRVDRTLRPEDSPAVRAFAREALPGVGPEVVAGSVCMYTMSPDGHFIIDRLPGAPSVCFAAGFSGHGFKFAPLVGEALADLALHGATRLPIGFLGVGRFAKQ